MRVVELARRGRAPDVARATRPRFARAARASIFSDTWVSFFNRQERIDTVDTSRVGVSQASDARSTRARSAPQTSSVASSRRERLFPLSAKARESVWALGLACFFLREICDTFAGATTSADVPTASACALASALAALLGPPATEAAFANVTRRCVAKERHDGDDASTGCCARTCWYGCRCACHGATGQPPAPRDEDEAGESSEEDPGDDTRSRAAQEPLELGARVEALSLSLSLFRSSRAPRRTNQQKRPDRTGRRRHTLFFSSP